MVKLIALWKFFREKSSNKLQKLKGGVTFLGAIWVLTRPSFLMMDWFLFWVLPIVSVDRFLRAERGKGFEEVYRFLDWSPYFEFFTLEVKGWLFLWVTLTLVHIYVLMVYPADHKK